MNPYFVVIVGILGLVIGSLLNVIIYRLPIGLTKDFNLFIPRSHCPKCKKIIPLWHNIPLLSYCLLRGKCANCKHPITWRYPLVELLSCIASIIVAIRFGMSWQTYTLLPLTWGLIALAFIDIENLLLPDVITFLLLWYGLLVSIFGIFVHTNDAIIGVVTGYLALWLIANLFHLIRGIEGMGYGDFKLLAMFGAWVGWQNLPLLVLIASVTGAVAGITMILLKKRVWQHQFPFGPYLICAGWIILIFNLGK